MVRIQWIKHLIVRRRCISIMSGEDKAEFHKKLDEAREFWSREDSDTSTPFHLPRDHITFNVSFNVVYTNKSVEGGYVA